MLAVLRVREKTLGVARRDIGLIALTAIVGVTVNQAFFVYSLTNTGASDVAFLFATGPLVTALLATAIGLERLGRRHWLSALAGLVVLLTGAVFLVLARVKQKKSAVPVPDRSKR